MLAKVIFFSHLWLLTQYLQSGSEHAGKVATTKEDQYKPNQVVNSCIYSWAPRVEDDCLEPVVDVVYFSWIVLMLQDGTYNVLCYELKMSLYVE